MSDTDWTAFLTQLKAAGGSTDMQTSKTGRYPWLFHFCRGEEARLVDVVVCASIWAGPNAGKVLKSPPRDWSTKEKVLADYAALHEHGGSFNDTRDALEALKAAP